MLPSTVRAPVLRTAHAGWKRAEKGGLAPEGLASSPGHAHVASWSVVPCAWLCGVCVVGGCQIVVLSLFTGTFFFQMPSSPNTLNLNMRRGVVFIS